MGTLQLDRVDSDIDFKLAKQPDFSLVFTGELQGCSCVCFPSRAFYRNRRNMFTVTTEIVILRLYMVRCIFIVMACQTDLILKTQDRLV